MTGRYRLAPAFVLASFVFLSGSSEAAPPAAAPPAKEASKAEQLFDEGTRLLDEKRFEEALPKLLESRKLGAGIGVAMYIGDCYDGLGRTAKALVFFREAEQLAHAKKDPRETVARERAEELLGSVPSVVVQVTTPVEKDLVVTLDEEPLEAERWAKGIQLDPGSHVVRATAGADRWELPFELPARTGTTVVQIPHLHKPPSPTDFVTSLKARPMRLAAIAQLTGGGILVGVGMLFGIAAIRKQDASLEDGHCDAAARCDATGLELRDDGLSAASASTVLVTLGLLAAASGAVFYYLDTTQSRSRSGHTFIPKLSGSNVLLRF